MSDELAMNLIWLILGGYLGWIAPDFVYALKKRFAKRKASVSGGSPDALD